MSINQHLSPLDGVRIYLVMSGKGGVGKSSVATLIALGLVEKGMRVGLLDIDLCGPSIPRMLNLRGQQVHQCSEGWVPVYTDTSQRLAVMSIGFLLENENDAVVWRGPKKNAMIKQFVESVYWRDIDCLVIDTPPGTSDEHITIGEALRNYKPEGAILVTTPQAVAVNDVRREVTFCKKVGIPILGIVENMSGFVCSHCEVGLFLVQYLNMAHMFIRDLIHRGYRSCRLMNHQWVELLGCWFKGGEYLDSHTQMELFRQ